MAQQFPQSNRGAAAHVTKQQSAPVQRLPGIPGYQSQLEGLSISQALVNDIMVDLQSKVINESQQQFYSESSTGNYLGKNHF